MRLHWVARTATAAAVILLGACATQDRPVAPPVEPLWTGTDEVRDRLAESAHRAVMAHETLAMIERTRDQPAPSPLDETVLPPELQRSISFDWSGPGEEAARQIAREIGYELSVSGNPPAVTPMVHLALRDTASGKILENLGHQVHPKAAVMVDPNLRRIEFRYAPQGAN